MARSRSWASPALGSQVWPPSSLTITRAEVESAAVPLGPVLGAVQPLDGHPVRLGQGFFILGAAYNGTCNYDISNNGTAVTPLVGNRQGGMIHVNKGSGTATFNGRIQNNFIGNAAVTNSGSLEAFGIIVGARGAGG